MKPEYILPTITMLINLGSAVVYLSQGNFRMFMYWIAAVVLTFCVTIK